MEHPDFHSFLREKMRERGLTLRRLAELSGIPLHQLETLSEGRLERFPPAPYLRGYLSRLGRILEFDPDVWVEHFEEVGALPTSGLGDELPKNRFAPQSIAKYFWFGIALFLVLLYFAFTAPSIFGKPRITVSVPPGETATATTDTLTLAGKAERSDQFFINGESIPLREGGWWEKRVVLQPGLNTIELRAKKFLGGEATLIRQIVYELPKAEATEAPF